MEAFCIGINPDFESTGKLFEIGTINLDGIGALIIGPNMQAKKADLLKVMDVLECLSGHMDCTLISGTPFVAFFYKGRTVKLQENEYIRGAMIVFKLTEYGIELLHDEDYKPALKEMESRRTVITVDERCYTAFKTN